MKINFRNLTGLLFIVTAASVPSTAIAQPNTNIQTTDNITIPEAFERAFFKNDPQFFRNNSIERQVNVIFGPGSLLRNSFPEHEISRDARLVHQLYEQVLNQQTSSDPVVRTPDLPNPYSTSILSSPRLDVNSNNNVKVNELIYER